MVGAGRPLMGKKLRRGIMRLKVLYEFSCSVCGIGFCLTGASFRGVGEPRCCPFCGGVDLMKLDERVVESMPVVTPPK